MRFRFRFRTSDFVEVVEGGCGTRGTADNISGVWIPEPRGAAAKIGGGVLKLKENIFEDKIVENGIKIHTFSVKVHFIHVKLLRMKRKETKHENRKKKHIDKSALTLIQVNVEKESTTVAI